MTRVLFFVLALVLVATAVFVYRYWPALAALWAAAWIIRTTNRKEHDHA